MAEPGLRHPLGKRTRPSKASGGSNPPLSATFSNYVTTPHTTMETQKEIYLRNHQKKIDAGLIHISITPNPNRPGNPTEEEIYGELNRIDAAPDAPDPEILGEYSPKIPPTTRENPIPNPPPTSGCYCMDKPADCVCGENEIHLRGWVAEKLPPMTPEQREWCLQEIQKVEGYNRQDYETSPDKDLANGVLRAWQSFCKDKGLI